VLELPERSCNDQHNVLVVFKRFDKVKKKDKELLSVTGKVLQIQEVGEGKLRVFIECIQYDEKGWQTLLALFNARQEQIQRFLESVRGY
jgi:hypothetical protein